jgi:hypothetical protein
VGPRAGLDAVEMRKIPNPCRDRDREHTKTNSAQYEYYKENRRIMNSPGFKFTVNLAAERDILSVAFKAFGRDKSRSLKDKDIQENAQE